MKIVMVAAVFAALVGCAPKPIEGMSYSETKDLALQLHQRCAEQGAPRGSAEFHACMQQELTREQYSRHEARERADRARIGLAAGLGGMGRAMQNNAAAMRPAPSTPVQCRSVRSVDGSVNTSCY